MKMRKNVQVNRTKKKSIKTLIKNNWQIYAMLLPLLVYFFVFNYMPMNGVQIAFRDYKITKGIWGSEWVGLEYFKNFLNAYYFKRLISNTLILNLIGLLCSFPIPLILAISLNRVRNDRVKRFIQTTIYMPYFISVIVLAGMLYIFLSPSVGIAGHIMTGLGIEKVDLMSEPSAFRPIYILSGIWQGSGYSSILYIACLAGVDPTLYEAAEIDGASVWQKIWHIDIPSIIPTAVMCLILDSGRMFSDNTSKALALQTAGNISTSDLLGVYVYNMGINGGQFSYTSAIGLFTNIVNFIMIITVNKISNKLSNTALF